LLSPKAGVNEPTQDKRLTLMHDRARVGRPCPGRREIQARGARTGEVSSLATRDVAFVAWAAAGHVLASRHWPRVGRLATSDSHIADDGLSFRSAESKSSHSRGRNLANELPCKRPLTEIIQHETDSVCRDCHSSARTVAKIFCAESWPQRLPQGLLTWSGATSLSWRSGCLHEKDRRGR